MQTPVSLPLCSVPFALQLISFRESSSTLFSPFPTGQYRPFSYLCCAVATLVTAFGGYLLENQTKLSSIQGKDKLLACQSRCPSLHNRHKVFVRRCRVVFTFLSPLSGCRYQGSRSLFLWEEKSWLKTKRLQTENKYNMLHISLG